MADWILRPAVNGILETSLYVESAARSAEFYRRIFGFEAIELSDGEPLSDSTRLCAMRAGDRDILLLFKKGATHDTDATGAIHIAFGIARPDLMRWENWLQSQGIEIGRVENGSTAAKRFIFAILTAIFWRWSLPACGVFTSAPDSGRAPARLPRSAICPYPICINQFDQCHQRYGV